MTLKLKKYIFNSTYSIKKEMLNPNAAEFLAQLEKKTDTFNLS